MVTNLRFVVHHGFVSFLSETLLRTALMKGHRYVSKLSETVRRASNQLKL